LKRLVAASPRKQYLVSTSLVFTMSTTSLPPHGAVSISAEAMADALRHSLTPTVLEVIDESAQHAGHAGANGSGWGTHFRVRIASPLFDGKARVARHRLVYDSLQHFIDQGVHAIAIEVL
jgi:BolA protein